MKILCFIDSLGSGGAQRQLINLAIGFKEKGHDVSFLVYHEINFFKPELDAQGITVNSIIEPNYWKRILKIRKFIRNNKQDAVLAFLEGSSFMATIAGFPCRKWKLVVGERSANPAIMTSTKLRFYRLFHIFTDYVVANSQANLEMVRKVNPLLPSKKLRVIYNILNLPNMTRIETEDSSKAYTHIVIAASYRPVKNLNGLVEAISILPDEYKNKLRVEWYGNKIVNDTYLNSMEAKIVEYGLKKIIRLNNATKNIYEKYASSDFVGLFSHYEGFPNSVCEAMALGKPLIVTRISDIPNFVKEGINGFLCDSLDPNSIRSALMQAINSTKEVRYEIGIRNKENANLKFNKGKILDSYLRLLSM